MDWRFRLTAARCDIAAGDSLRANTVCGHSGQATVVSNFVQNIGTPDVPDPPTFGAVTDQFRSRQLDCARRWRLVR